MHRSSSIGLDYFSASQRPGVRDVIIQARRMSQHNHYPEIDYQSRALPSSYLSPSNNHSPHSYSSYKNGSVKPNLNSAFQMMLLMEQISKKSPSSKHRTKQREKEKRTNQILRAPYGPTPLASMSKLPKYKTKPERSESQQSVQPRQNSSIARQFVPHSLEAQAMNYAFSPSKPASTVSQKKVVKAELKELKKQRGKLNIKKLKILISAFLRFKRNVQELARNRKKESENEFSNLYAQFETASTQWVAKIVSPILQNLNKINIQVVKALMTNSLLQKRQQNLRDFVKTLLVSLVSNTEIPDTALQYFVFILAPNQQLPKGHFCKFELSFLEFNVFGLTIGMTAERQCFLILVSILIRVLCHKVICAFPATEIMKVKVQLVISIIHDLVVDWVEFHELKRTKPCPIKPKEPFYFTLQGYPSEPLQEKRLKQAETLGQDLPMLHPIYQSQELVKFDKNFQNSCIGLMNNYSEDILDRVLPKIKEIEEKGKSIRRLALSELVQFYNQNIQKANQVVQQKKQDYESLCRKIEALKNHLGSL